MARTGITLNVGGNQVIDIQMKIGRVTEHVEVDESAPILQLGSSELTSVVDSTTVRELPLNGRSWVDLATLQPGVVKIQSASNPASGADRGEHRFGTQLSISGTKPVQNNYRLDGISVNDYANGAPGSVLGYRWVSTASRNSPLSPAITLHSTAESQVESSTLSLMLRR